MSPTPKFRGSSLIFCPTGFLPRREDRRLYGLKGKRRDAAKLAMAKAQEAAVEYIEAEARRVGPALLRLDTARKTEERKYEVFCRTQTKRLADTYRKLAKDIAGEFDKVELVREDAWVGHRHRAQHLEYSFPNAQHLFVDITMARLNQMRLDLEAFIIGLRPKPMTDCRPTDEMKPTVKDPQLVALLESFQEALMGTDA